MRLRLGFALALAVVTPAGAVPSMGPFAGLKASQPTSEFRVPLGARVPAERHVRTSGAVTSSQSSDSIPPSVALHPYTHQHFVCLEHPLGQLKRLGDALGSDCVIVGFGNGTRAKFPSFYQGSGASNSDWIGWRASVLAPFDGRIDSVNVNTLTNIPGVLGELRASVIIFRRSDGLRVLYAHVQEIMVKVGDSVRAGQQVALVGNNGPAYFPHTHIGAYKDGEPLQVRFDLAAMGTMPRSDSK